MKCNTRPKQVNALRVPGLYFELHLQPKSLYLTVSCSRLDKKEKF